jgi:hypothetical protein
MGARESVKSADTEGARDGVNKLLSEENRYNCPFKENNNFLSSLAETMQKIELNEHFVTLN